MDKLYYVVCEEQDTTLFEGRFQGRTRGAALKFLKDRIGRKSLSGVVFTITEIPVPLIREIVAEILAGGNLPAANVVPLTRTEPAPEVGDPAPAADVPQVKVTPSKAGRKATAKPAPVASDGRVGNPGFGDDLWTQARAFWDKCHCIRKTAEKFGLSPESVKTRARREGWRK